MTDLQAKYQKLASEYSKLRAQIPVLKKAVHDEKDDKDILKEHIKEKEQSVRRFEQEIDSLSFRNTQLSKRVIFLQEELETAETGKKKSKNKGSFVDDLPDARLSAASQPIGVFDEELNNKIEENARLHRQVQEVEDEFRSKVTLLKDRLSHYEHESAQHQEVLSSTVKANKNQVSRLQEEKAMLEVKLQSLEQELKGSHGRAQTAEQQLGLMTTDLQERLHDATRILNTQLPFVDTRHRELNALNLPTHDRKHQLQTKELVGQAVTMVTELIQGLSNFFTYTEQRCRIYPADEATEPLSTVNMKFAAYLHENAGFLRPIEHSLVDFHNSLREDCLTVLETAVELQPFGQHFKQFVQYMNKLLPYQILSLEEESALSSCPSTLEAKNKELLTAMKRLTNIFSKIDTYISILCAQSQGGNSCSVSQSCHERLFHQLAACLRNLHDAVREVSKHFNSKVSLEHQLPTATHKLKTTDECIVSSLVSVVASTGKLSAFMTGNCSFFTSPAGYRMRGSSLVISDVKNNVKSNPIVMTFRQKTANYIASLARPMSESVPYRVAVQNRRTILSSAESRESLAQQLLILQEKVNKLEQEKEHWMLELQLLQIKYDKKEQTVRAMEKHIEASQVTTSLEDNLDLSTGSNPSSAPITVTSTAPSMLGHLEQAPSFGSDTSSREHLIKDHFSNRINELTVQQQVADSKALNFHAEVRALHRRLQISERDKDQQQEELTTSSQTIAQLQDELQTTTRSYEGQLSMMSDHLAAMNEKLAHQKDEIDELRIQLTQKNVKKSRK